MVKIEEGVIRGEGLEGRPELLQSLVRSTSCSLSRLLPPHLPSVDSDGTTDSSWCSTGLTGTVIRQPETDPVRRELVPRTELAEVNYRLLLGNQPHASEPTPPSELQGVCV